MGKVLCCRLALAVFGLSACSPAASNGPSVPSAIPDAAIPEPTYREARGVFHVHSPYSHDACDGKGLRNDGTPNPECLSDLRKAMCASGFDFVALTDHPDHMKDYSFENDLLFDSKAGDTLVEVDGEPIANRVHCGNGRDVLLTVGYESKHTMPLGLHHHMNGNLYRGLQDKDPLAYSQKLIDGIKEAGGVVAIAHSEEDDLSAKRIVEVGVEAMEWYNPHGNFKSLMDGDTITGDPIAAINTLGRLEAFLLGSKSGAQADLVYMLLLPFWPQAGFDKWSEVQKSARVTGILGSDVHQNVAVDPVCKGAVQPACEAAATAFPSALTLLISGGTITLTDGERFDSYARLFRWLSNRVMVPEGDLKPEGLLDAVRRGRVYGVFTVFGEPEGFSFSAVTPTEETRPLGAKVTVGSILKIKIPDAPVPVRSGASFLPDEAKLANVRAVLLRTDANGTEMVKQYHNLGEEISLEAPKPGKYHVEIWIEPRHLATALGSKALIASDEYLWLLTNPIEVTP